MQKRTLVLLAIMCANTIYGMGDKDSAKMVGRFRTMSDEEWAKCKSEKSGKLDTSVESLKRVFPMLPDSAFESDDGFVPQVRYGSPLHEAIGKRDIDEVRRLVAAGADLTKRGINCHTPLGLAVARKNVAACVAILEKGVDINTVVSKAFMSESVEIRELFARKYVDENRDKIKRELLDEPLVQSIAAGNQERFDQYLPPFKDESSVRHSRKLANGIEYCFTLSNDLDALRLFNAELLQNKQKEFDECFSAAVFAAVNARNFSALKRLIEYKAV